MNTDASRKQAKASNPVTHPQQAFDTPMEVVNAPHLPDHKKEKALETWEEDERALQRASEEGMTGGERPRLHEVKKAQQRLEEKKPD
jgi:hypothetical protein